ncbi:uncharacterized protein LOC113324335 [Papaver somniferum]|uniref:uncharacterized protein LOC113324335 n=1 Tax=Papaver somniferum TaxID=3469 RepID=UPI000E703B71|nr:uncharacterized protein LOC113324335 [Papaver somniferum]
MGLGFGKAFEQLIDQDSKSWKTDILNALFDEDTVKRITDIRIPIAGKDKLRWEPSNNEVFTIKSAYNSILNENLDVKPTKNNLDICWKTFWRYKLSPRIQYFIWKFLHGWISTKHTLARFTRHKDSSRAIYNGNLETIQYLFFDCHHVRHIWDAVNSRLTIILQGLDLHKWMCSFFLKANISVPKDFSMYESIEDWISAKNIQNSSNNTLRITDKIWKAHANDIYKINFDASFIAKTVLSGWGLICRDSAANNYGLRGGASLAIDPEQAEAQSLLEAVQWACRNGWRKIHLEGDCQNIIATVNGKATSVKWVCTYAHREVNHIADSIAKSPNNLFLLVK